MKALFTKTWLAAGTVMIIIVTSILIAVVRTLKFLKVGRTAVSPEGDIFHDSRKHPLPPTCKTQDGGDSIATEQEIYPASGTAPVRGAGVYSVAWFLAAVLIPLVLVVSWNHFNTVYPNDDAADYFKTTQQISQKFHSEGLKSGITAAYLLRGWRPVLYPVVAVPFYLATGGSISATVLLTMSFAFALLLIYTYLLAREYLPPHQSFLCTVFFGTTYWVASSTYYFFSEIWLYACAMAILYYIKKCDFFTSRRHSVLLGLAIGVGIASKPTELIMSLGIFMAVYIAVSIRRHHISKAEFFLSLYIVLVVAIIVVSYAYFHPVPRKAVLPGAVAMLLLTGVPLFIFKKKARYTRSPFVLATFFAGIVSGVWWLPKFYEYIDYAYTGGLGDMARLYNLGQRDFIGAMRYFSSALGGYPLLLLIVTAVLGFLLKKKRDEGVLRHFRIYALIAIPMVVIPVFMMSLSPSTDPRRASLSFAVLLLMTSMLAVQPGLILPKFRTMLIAALCLVQFLMISSSTFGFNLPGARYMSAYVHSVPLPVRGGDPSEKTLQEIRRLKVNGTSVAALTLTMSLSVGSFNEKPFDPHMLNGLSEKYATGVSFGYPWNFEDLDKGYEALWKGYSMVLLDVSTVPPEKMEITEPSMRLTIDLIDHWKKATLAEVKFREIADFTVNGKELVLMKKIDLDIFPEGNLALSDNGSVPGATSVQNGFSVSGLNDEDLNTVWGSAETTADTVFYVTMPGPRKAARVRVMTFATRSGNHLRDISVVGTNEDVNGTLAWKVIRARIGDSGPYSTKVAVPDLPDKSVVTLSLDPNDKNLRSYKTLGIACLSGTSAYERNYVAVGNGIYVRDISIF